MKKFQALGRSLSKAEQKMIMGGVTDPGDGGGCCSNNSYCGTGSACVNKCCSGNCEAAGNASNPNTAGGDKICA